MSARRAARAESVSGRTSRGWLALLVGLCGCGPIGRDALWGRPIEPADASQTGAPSCALDEPDPPALPPTPGPSGESAPHRYFALSVQDQDGAPVSGATLRTVNHVRLRSDAHGKVAFYEPELMGLEVYFFAEREGYELAPDGFGNRGKAFRVDEGGSGVITLARLASAPAPSDASDLQSRLLTGPVRTGAACFAIRVVDQATKRGVPLVLVESSEERLVTDSQGFAADCHPDHRDQRVRYALSSHGYAFPAGDIELEVQPGASALLELTRLNIAERLYRSTGQGIYRESQLLGLTSPGSGAPLRGRVMQQDAVSVAEHQGQLFWLWGNTDRPAYPLGNFWGSAATSALASDSDPSLGLQFEYLVGDSGVARAMGQTLAPANLPSWLSSLISLPDADGSAQLFAVYGKPRADLSLAARGLARLEADQIFHATGVSYPAQDFVGPRGQPVRVHHREGEYVYFAPPLRIKASAESLLDPASYELFTAFEAGPASPLRRAQPDTLAYAFRSDARPTRAQDVSAAGLPRAQSLDGHWADALTGSPIRAADDGAAAFSPHHQRFVRVFQQLGGLSSFAGEIWYAEADTPLGPWVYAQKILTHDRYTFYSPWLHPYFEQGTGRFLCFEGSYTTALAGEGVEPTPRYERNQIAYRLDLDDPRLLLPVPVYDPSADGARLATRRDLPADAAPLAPAFFALERAAPDTRPLYWSGPDCAPRRLLLGNAAHTPALFYAFAPDESRKPAQLVPLYELSDARGTHAYATSAALDGFTRAAEPLAYVWPSPIAVPLPVTDFAPPLLANAGPDQCPREQEAGRGATIALSAAGSRSEQAITQYRWYLDDAECPFAEGESATLHLHSGVHAIMLRVRDGAGHRAEDSLLLEVTSRERADQTQ
jgi:hypothetical protein